MEDLPRPGAPRKTTARQDVYIKSRAARDDWNATDIQRGLKKEGSPRITPRTIERRLNEAGLIYKSTKKKPPLKPEHFIERVRIANRLKSRRFDKVLFTDYAKYELGSRKRYAWTKKKERKYAVKKTHPPKFNFWVSFAQGGQGILHMFDENLTGDLHYNILKKWAPKAAKNLFRGKWWLLTDNDPKTVTPEILERLRQLGFNRLEFSRYSPDLNVSENVIDLLKNKTAARNPVTVDEAKRYLKEEFEKIPKNIFQSLVGSMKDRCQAVIDAEGGYTDY
jgi:hypothetical protein